jgi:hypothetical protein
MRDFKQVPQTANLQARYELAGLTIPQDRIQILDNTAAYDTAHAMVASDGAPYVGYGAPDFGTHYQAGRP